MRRRIIFLLCAVSSAGCSTLAEAGGGNDNLPNAGVGPFREIDNEELGQGRAAPYAFRDDDDFQRDAAYLKASAEPGVLETWAYVAHTVFGEEEEPDAAVSPNEITRHEAIDGRSFARQFEVALTAEQDWEMGTIGHPAVLRVDGQVHLYYAGAGGIGLATSSDGRSFTREGDGLVLAPAGGWEEMVPPTSPVVLEHPTGGLRMYYAVPLSSGSAIGVATSSDGVSWQRTGDAPTLAPRAGESDAAGVDAPFAITGRSVEDRLIEFLYYAATDADGKRTIAMVARFDGEGAWDYATAPIFGSTGSLQPTEPVIVPFAGYSLLFVTQKAGSTAALDYPAVAIGVAPAQAVLPAPNPP